MTPANSLSAVSLTPENNLLAVLLTPAITFFPGVIDTGQKKPKTLKFIIGVNDTGEKFIGGVFVTGDTPVRNLSLISTTPAKIFDED